MNKQEAADKLINMFGNMNIIGPTTIIFAAASDSFVLISSKGFSSFVILIIYYTSH